MLLSRSATRERVARRSLPALVLLCIVALFATRETRADEPVKLAVFPFELEDFSAAGGGGPPDARDSEYLAEATEEAKRQLEQSGRYALVDTAAAAQEEAVKSGTLHSCEGCVGPIAKKLGADQAVVGSITRISRTEYTLLIEFFDAVSGKSLAQHFSGLRMGADYSWARGTRSLMKNRILAKARE